eukprot:COSAG02_NODE_16386_length_1087_cov_15.433198_1_plen_110_part_01
MPGVTPAFSSRKVSQFSNFNLGIGIPTCIRRPDRCWGALPGGRVCARFPCTRARAGRRRRGSAPRAPAGAAEHAAARAGGAERRSRYTTCRGSIVHSTAQLAMTKLIPRG